MGGCLGYDASKRKVEPHTSQGGQARREDSREALHRGHDGATHVFLALTVSGSLATELGG